MSNEKIESRVRKLLELSKSTNEHEAANAAARAAAMMSEHGITEAMLQVTSDDDGRATRDKESIVEAGLPDDTERRVAWRDRIASAMARSLDCETFFSRRPDGVNTLTALGRESAVQTWTYTTSYLLREVERLADQAWKDNGADLAAVGILPRNWKASFRLGAADVIATRLYQALQERAAKETAKAKELAAPSLQDSTLSLPEPGIYSDDEVTRAGESLALARVDAALEIVKRDRQEVKKAFENRTSGPEWRMSRGATGGSARAGSGYGAGRQAGQGVNIGARGGKALGSGS
jgi:hypothetical protein